MKKITKKDIMKLLKNTDFHFAIVIFACIYAAFIPGNIFTIPIILIATVSAGVILFKDI